METSASAAVCPTHTRPIKPTVAVPLTATPLLSVFQLRLKQNFKDSLVQIKQHMDRMVQAKKKFIQLWQMINSQNTTAFSDI